MDDALQLAVESAPDATDLALLEERFAAAAVEALGIGPEQEFGVFARNDVGQIVAGASGTIRCGCCQVHVLWVDEPLRGGGLGRTLMAHVEAEALRRGCRMVMGLTYDVLIGDFYDRLGYHTVGCIEDCPADTTTRWYRKDLRFR